MALTTIARVKELLGIKQDDATKDAILATFVERVSKSVADRTNRTFEYQASIIDYFDGDGIGGEGWDGKSQWIPLRNYPVDLSVPVTIYDDPARLYPASTLIQSTDYAVDEINGIIKLDGTRAFNRGHKNIKITYAAGYKTIPQDLEYAAILYCAADFIESQGELQSVVAIEVSSRIKALRDQADALAGLYIRPIF